MKSLKRNYLLNGYFDESKKKKLPYIPKRVGVITSKTGSVIQDIINVTTRRYNKVDLLIYPAYVQGVNTAISVIKGIELFNLNNSVDVIIIARGGGSFEDLNGFNDEALADCIYNSHIPIISAVGHETDFTICDFVSDMRAPTPSAAAEIVYPKTSDLIDILNNKRDKNTILIKNFIKFKKEYIKRIKSYKLEKVPFDIINNSRLIIDKVILQASNKTNYMLNDYRLKFNNCLTKLEALSPINTMKRGYSVVEYNNKLISSVKNIKIDDNLKVVLSDGNINVLVKEISK
ncbi:MAG: exodeoxyribonuclease VII large subunit [Clostridia bacterium]